MRDFLDTALDSQDSDYVEITLDQFSELSKVAISLREEELSVGLCKVIDNLVSYENDDFKDATISPKEKKKANVFQEKQKKKRDSFESEQNNTCKRRSKPLAKQCPKSRHECTKTVRSLGAIKKGKKWTFYEYFLVKMLRSIFLWEHIALMSGNSRVGLQMKFLRFKRDHKNELEAESLLIDQGKLKRDVCDVLEEEMAIMAAIERHEIVEELRNSPKYKHVSRKPLGELTFNKLNERLGFRDTKKVCKAIEDDWNSRFVRIQAVLSGPYSENFISDTICESVDSEKRKEREEGESTHEEHELLQMYFYGGCC